MEGLTDEVSLPSPQLLTSEPRGSGRGAATAALGNEVCHLTPLALEVKKLVTTDDFSRAFCLHMAFQ